MWDSRVSFLCSAALLGSCFLKMVTHQVWSKFYLGFESLNKSVSGVGLLGTIFMEEKPLVLTIKTFEEIWDVSFLFRKSICLSPRRINLMVISPPSFRSIWVADTCEILWGGRLHGKLLESSAGLDHSVTKPISPSPLWEDSSPINRPVESTIFCHLSLLS